MVHECYYCKRGVDTGNDAHYRCERRGHDVVVCEDCYRHHRTCPECGGRLEFFDESIMKRVFQNPAKRGLLGWDR